MDPFSTGNVRLRRTLPLWIAVIVGELVVIFLLAKMAYGRVDAGAPDEAKPIVLLTVVFVIHSAILCFKARPR